MSDYAHSTGFLNFWGYDPMTQWNWLANVTRPAARGDSRLYVTSTAKLAPLVGKQVRFIMDGDYAGQLTDMYGGEFLSGERAGCVCMCIRGEGAARCISARARARQHRPHGNPPNKTKQKRPADARPGAG